MTDLASWAERLLRLTGGGRDSGVGLSVSSVL